MKPTFALIVAAALAASPATAAEKLPVDQVLQIAVSLSQLQCGNKMVKEGGAEKIVCEPYKWPADLSWRIARNLRKARDVASDYDRMLEQERSKMARDKDGQPTEKASAELTVTMRARLDSQINVDFERFTRAELEPMNLPPNVISALLPIIE